MRSVLRQAGDKRAINPDKCIRRARVGYHVTVGGVVPTRVHMVRDMKGYMCVHRCMHVCVCVCAFACACVRAYPCV